MVRLPRLNSARAHCSDALCPPQRATEAAAGAGPLALLVNHDERAHLRDLLHIRNNSFRLAGAGAPHDAALGTAISVEQALQILLCIVEGGGVVEERWQWSVGQQAVPPATVMTLALFFSSFHHIRFKPGRYKWVHVGEAASKGKQCKGKYHSLCGQYLTLYIERADARAPSWVQHMPKRQLGIAPFLAALFPRNGHKLLRQALELTLIDHPKQQERKQIVLRKLADGAFRLRKARAEFRKQLLNGDLSGDHIASWDALLAELCGCVGERGLRSSYVLTCCFLAFQAAQGC